MMYEAVPASVQASPSLLAQYVQGRLPGVREVADPTENVRQLVEMVEQGLITVEAIRGSFGDVVDPALADQVTTLVQARHTEAQATTKAADLDAAGLIELTILPGVDDVTAAMKHAKVKPDAWTLHGDVLQVVQVKGVTGETVAAALQATRH